MAEKGCEVAWCHLPQERPVVCGGLGENIHGRIGHGTKRTCDKGRPVGTTVGRSMGAPRMHGSKIQRSPHRPRGGGGGGGGS